jgi:hypothetical protein
VSRGVPAYKYQRGRNVYSNVNYGSQDLGSRKRGYVSGSGRAKFVMMSRPASCKERIETAWNYCRNKMLFILPDSLYCRGVAFYYQAMYQLTLVTAKSRRAGDIISLQI